MIYDQTPPVRPFAPSWAAYDCHHYYQVLVTFFSSHSATILPVRALSSQSGASVVVVWSRLIAFQSEAVMMLTHSLRQKTRDCDPFFSGSGFPPTTTAYSVPVNAKTLDLTLL